MKFQVIITPYKVNSKDKRPDNIVVSADEDFMFYPRLLGLGMNLHSTYLKLKGGLQIDYSCARLNNTASLEFLITSENVFREPTYPILQTYDLVSIYYYDVLDIDTRILNSNLVFTGYITNITNTYATDSSYSFSVSLGSFLSQFQLSTSTWNYTSLTGKNAIQTSVSSFNDFTFPQLLQKMLSDSIYDVLTTNLKNNLTKSTKSFYQPLVEANSGGVNGLNFSPFINPKLANTLTINKKVWAFMSGELSKQDAVISILYPYQMVMYEDEFARINVMPLSMREDDIVDIELNNNYSNFRVYDTSSQVPNTVFAYAVDLPFRAIQLGEEKSTENIFSTINMPTQYRAGQVLATAKNPEAFRNLRMKRFNLNSSMVKDPTLLTYVSKLSKGNSNNPQSIFYNTLSNVENKDIKNAQGLAGVYACREMAQIIFDMFRITIEVPLEQFLIDNKFPNLLHGQTIRIDIPEITTNYGYIFLVESVNISQGNGTIMTLTLRNVYSYTALWDTD